MAKGWMAPERTGKFAVGDLVHATDDGTIGRIAFCRADGWCSVVGEGTGSREWVPQAQLCNHWLASPTGT